jgi:hypothetical protein
VTRFGRFESSIVGQVEDMSPLVVVISIPGPPLSLRSTMVVLYNI